MIAPLKRHGWGATCGKHKNVGDGPRACCKKSISVGTMSNDECCLRMKMWLLLGSTVDASDPEARGAHRKINIKDIPLWTSEEIENCKPDDVEIPPITPP